MTTYAALMIAHPKRQNRWEDEEHGTNNLNELRKKFESHIVKLDGSPYDLSSNSDVKVKGFRTRYGRKITGL